MRSQDALVVRTNTLVRSSNSHTNNDVDWVDTVERTASVMKKFFTRTTCRLCQVYADEQVQYEVQLEQTKANHGDINSSSSPWLSSVRNLEVELYRQFLFDENSVIEHVDSFRDETEDMPESDGTEQEMTRMEASPSSQDGSAKEDKEDVAAAEA